MYAERLSHEIAINWANGQTLSDQVSLESGAFGTLLVPSGSTLIGKDLNILAVTQLGNFALLGTAKTLAAGANHFTSSEIAEVGAAGRVIFQLSAGVTGAAAAALLWKS